MEYLFHLIFLGNCIHRWINSERTITTHRSIDTSALQVMGGSLLKYGAELLSSNVWHTSHTWDVRIFGPDCTTRLTHLWQKIWPQWRQWCFAFRLGKDVRQFGHCSMSSSCCHRTWSLAWRIFSSWICKLCDNLTKSRWTVSLVCNSSCNECTLFLNSWVWASRFFCIGMVTWFY